MQRIRLAATWSPVVGLVVPRASSSSGLARAPASRNLLGARPWRHHLRAPPPRPFSTSAPVPAGWWGWGASSSSSSPSNGTSSDIAVTATTPMDTTFSSVVSPAPSTLGQEPTISAPPPPPDTAAEFITSSPLIEALEQGTTTGHPLAMEAITAVGDFAQLGLASGWGPTAVAERFLELAHVTLGSPWWLTILGATAVVRLLLLPVMIKVTKSAAAMQNIKHLTDPISAKVTAYRAEKKVAQAQAESLKLFALFREHKVNPLSGLWSMVQLPVFFGFFFAVQGVAELPVPGMAEGGLAWFLNLTAPDPTYILPVVAGATMLAALEAGPKLGDTGGAQAKMMRNLFRGMSGVMVVVMSGMPAAVSWYSVISNLFTLLQVLVLRAPAVRRALGIPLPRDLGPASAVAPKGNGFRLATPLAMSAAWSQLRAATPASATASAKAIGHSLPAAAGVAATSAMARAATPAAAVAGKAGVGKRMPSSAPSH